MNKFTRCALLLCAMFSFVSLVGCNNDVDEPDVKPTPGTPEELFKIESLEHDNVVVTITPSSEDVVYYAFLYPDTEEFMGRDNLEIYVDIRYSDYFEDLLASGTQTLTFQGLIGHSHYKVVYFEYDEATGKKVGDVLFSERITTPDAPEEIGLEISDITGMSAKITVTPPSEDMRYFCWVYPLFNYENYQHSSDYELLGYDYSYWAYASQMYGITLEEMIEFDTTIGSSTFSTDALLSVAEWNTEYLVWAYGVTLNGEATTNITRRIFKTASPEPSDMTFEVPNIDVVWYEEETAEGLLRGWRANATIIPSKKDENYFVTITNKSWYDWYFTEDNDGRNDDDFLMHEILYNGLYNRNGTSKDLAKMYKMGDSEFDCFTEREMLLRPDREYAVFVFGMDENGATTKLSVFPFTTGAMPQ